MLDLKFIRENTDLVRQAIANRQDTPPLDEILELDQKRRQKVLELESLRHERKKAAREREMVSSEEGRDLRTMSKGLEEEVRNLENLIILDLRENPLPIPPEILELIHEPAEILKHYFQLFSS